MSRVKLANGRHQPVPKQHRSNRSFPDHIETTSDRALYQQAHQRRHTTPGQFSVNDNVPRLGGRK